MSNLPHQTVEKLQKKKSHGVLRGPQLGKQRWRARLGILSVKNVRKLCFGTKLHSKYVIGPCLYQSGVPEDPTAIWCTPWGWHLVRRNALKYLNNKCNWGYSLCAGRSGDRIKVGGARFSAPVQTGPGAHPASNTMGTGSLLGIKRPGRGIDHPPPSSAEVKERVGLYLYSLSGPSWPFIEWI